MTSRHWKVVRLLTAIAIGVASAPLSFISVGSYFGLGSLLFVPALVVGIWLTLTASEELRAWWFGFVVFVGLWLPLCPWVEGCLHGIAVHLQGLSQRGALSLSQRVIEPTLIILVVLCPLLAACLLGIVVGSLTQRLARRLNRCKTAVSPHGRHWRFSLREMLIVFAVTCFLAAWIGGQARHWRGLERENQIVFLDRFKASFLSGQVELLAEPHLHERQRARLREFGPLSFRAPGVNEYRIVAPIRIEDKELWAVWAYTCNEEADEMIYKYAYAEAPVEEQLPEFPVPAQRYIEGAWEMVDGVPTTAGPAAAVTSVTSPVPVDQPLVLTASAPSGTVCELHLFPRDSLPSLPARKPDKNGIVSWTWNVSPDVAGYSIMYELRCIQEQGSQRMVSTTGGNIDVIAPDSSK